MVYLLIRRLSFWYDIHEDGLDLVLPLGILDMALVPQFCML